MGSGDNWDGKCTLITQTQTETALKSPQVVLSDLRAVWCKRVGVKQNEFYQAAQQGYRVEMQIEIRKTAYSAAVTHLRYKGSTYRILRTYQPKCAENIGLICVDKAGEAGFYGQ